MGGNAVQTPRVDVATFNRIKADVTNLLPQFCTDYRFPQIHTTKEDYGDVDIIINSNTLVQKCSVIDAIKSIFAPTKWHINGNVYSFAYQNFQIDFILRPATAMDAAYFYYSYGDFTILVGQLLRGLGFKLTDEGLYLPIGLLKTDFKKEFLITQNPNEILTFVGIDPLIYAKGFTTLEQMFSLVATSPYFDGNYYNIENFNHSARHRMRKRPTYNVFLDWLAGQTIPPAAVSVGKYAHIARARNHFPQFPHADITRHLASIRTQLQLREKMPKNYYRTLIADYPDKALGKIMPAWHKQFGTIEGHRQWVLDTPLDLIKQRFLDFVSTQFPLSQFLP